MEEVKTEAEINKIKLRLPFKNDYTTRESYKALRTNIQFCGSNKKLILITSCEPGDGKTSISLGIAKSLAELNKNVLYVDADLRKSSVLANYTSEKAICGLSQFLSGQSELSDAIFSTQYPFFYMIFAGHYPPNPVELLSSKRFKSFLEFAKSKYDYVIIDSPPLGLVIDAAVIATMCDGALMVINTGKTHGRLAANVLDQLKKSSCPVLGIVLNQVERKSKSYYKKYYSKYYAYGYTSSKNQQYQKYNVDDEE